mgnify:CR=1 FL=1
MSITLVDQTTVKLHTDVERYVWFADGSRVPVCSGLQVPDFVTAMLAQPGELHARIVGTQQNAQLITLLHRQARIGDTLEVASPLLCEAYPSVTPERVLQQMRRCQLPPSRGGWHLLTSLDAPAYELVYLLQQDAHFSTRVGDCLRTHTAWQPLSFIHSVQPSHVAWLLSFIVDPRWFLDQQHQQRSAKLRAYMGLTPATLRLALTRDISADSCLPPVVGRCRSVIGAWYRTPRPSAADMELPGNFLWRVYAASGDHFKGMLRACQQLINYLRNAWLALLAGRSELFMPECFFKTTTEIEAYQSHMAGWSRLV